MRTTATHFAHPSVICMFVCQAHEWTVQKRMNRSYNLTPIVGHALDAHWRHLANTIKRWVRGGDSAWCQITLTLVFFINVLKYIVLVVFLRHFNKYIPALECHLSRVCHNYREQRWNWVTFCDQGIQRPGDPVDPVILFYNELQNVDLCVKKYS